MPTRLKIAIQKSGRLYDDSLKLLKDCGIDLKNGINKLKTEADNFPMEVFFLHLPGNIYMVTKSRGRFGRSTMMVLPLQQLRYSLIKQAQRLIYRHLEKINPAKYMPWDTIPEKFTNLTLLILLKIFFQGQN